MPVTNNRLPVVAILLLLASPVFAGPQESKSLLASANGTGTLKIGQEQFKINAVVVKCLEDGSVEINLITEITIFLSGKWSRVENSPKVIKLEITGKATGGGIEASGEMILRDDGKSIDRLWMKGVSTTTKRSLEVNFQAQ